MLESTEKRRQRYIRETEEYLEATLGGAGRYRTNFAAPQAGAPAGLVKGDRPAGVAMPLVFLACIVLPPVIFWIVI